jgi:hypothetical protein
VIETIKVTNDLTRIGENVITTGNVQCYPNPTHDGLIHVESASDLQKIEIMNQWGSPVLIREVSGRITTLDVSQFISGLYIIEVTSRNGVDIQKFIKK